VKITGFGQSEDGFVQFSINPGTGERYYSLSIESFITAVESYLYTKELEAKYDAPRNPETSR
jgi:hypothetical protein